MRCALEGAHFQHGIRDAAQLLCLLMSTGESLVLPRLFSQVLTDNRLFHLSLWTLVFHFSFGKVGGRTDFLTLSCPGWRPRVKTTLPRGGLTGFTTSLTLISISSRWTVASSLEKWTTSRSVLRFWLRFVGTRDYFTLDP